MRRERGDEDRDRRDRERFDYERGPMRVSTDPRYRDDDDLTEWERARMREERGRERSGRSSGYGSSGSTGFGGSGYGSYGSTGYGSSGYGSSGEWGGYGSSSGWGREVEPMTEYGRERYRGRGFGREYQDEGETGGGWLRRSRDEDHDRGESWTDDVKRGLRDVGDRVRRFFGKGPKGYKRSDERIKEDVSDRLSEGYMDASEIEVSVSDGEVTLTGTVLLKSWKRMAEDLADEVPGVREVHNQIRVKRDDETRTVTPTPSVGKV